MNKSYIVLTGLWKKYLNSYLLLHNKKLKFFKQHDLWKFRKLLIKLFDYPETINNIITFDLKLSVLEYWLKIEGEL